MGGKVMEIFTETRREAVVKQADLAGAGDAVEKRVVGLQVIVGVIKERGETTEPLPADALGNLQPVAVGGGGDVGFLKPGVAHGEIGFGAFIPDPEGIGSCPRALVFDRYPGGTHPAIQTIHTRVGIGGSAVADQLHRVGRQRGQRGILGSGFISADQPNGCLRAVGFAIAV